MKNICLKRLHKVLSKYSKHRWFIGEIEDYYYELSKYWKSQPAETIAESVILMPQKRQKRNCNQNLKSKQNINHTSSIISINKSLKPKNTIRQILHLLYEENKINKKLYKNLMSL